MTGRRRILTLLAWILLLHATAATFSLRAQEQQQPGGAPLKAASPRAWRLRVSKGAPTTFTLQAENAPLSELAADFGRQLGLPVVVSPLMSKQRVTLDFKRLPLETAIVMLAPQPYVEYEIVGGPLGQPKPIALYLFAMNEKPPMTSAAVRSDSRSIIIEGNTEEAGELYNQGADRQLRVSYEGSRLSVRASKLPLLTVLFEIANKLDIPLDARNDSGEIVDIELSEVTIEQAMRSLPPAARLYVRTNLQTFESTPLRLILAAPIKE